MGGILGMPALFQASIDSPLVGGALPRTLPDGKRSMHHGRLFEISTRSHAGLRFIQSASQPGGEKTSGFATRQASSGSSAICERPMPPSPSPFRVRACSGAKAFHPNNASNVMTHGIMTLRSGRWRSALMDAVADLCPPSPQSSWRTLRCQTRINVDWRSMIRAGNSLQSIRRLLGMAQVAGGAFSLELSVSWRMVRAWRSRASRNLQQRPWFRCFS